MKNIGVQTHLKQLSEVPISTYIKQFSTNKFINPDNDKYVEDVIAAYWNMQDINNLKGQINPIYTYINKKFKDDPLLLDKLYKCRKTFMLQQKKYTESVNAICKFSKYYMFTTEYDNNIIPPTCQQYSSWGEISNTISKQLAIVIAHDDAQWVKSIGSPDDLKYIHGIQNIFKELSTNNNIFYISGSSYSNNIVVIPNILNQSQTNANNNNKLDDARKQISDKYSLIVGNIFNKDKCNLNNNYFGIIDPHGLINTKCLNIDAYREFLDKYLKNDYIREENPQLFTYTWGRFESSYEKLLRSLVDRAIIFIHQYMVDFFISVYEKSYTVPQLYLLFAPGTMCMCNQLLGNTHMYMVTNASPYLKGTDMEFTLNKLYITPTKKDGVFIHCNETMPFKFNMEDTPFKITETVTTTISNNRGNTAFAYFTIDDFNKLMTYDDVCQNLPIIKKTIDIYAGNTFKHLNGKIVYTYQNYTINKQNASSNTDCESRVIVNMSVFENNYSKLDNVSPGTHNLSEVADMLSVDSMSDMVMIGLPYTNPIFTSSTVEFITSDDFISDIRTALALNTIIPIMRLDNNQCCLAKVSDTSDIVFDDGILDKLVIDEYTKNFITTISKHYNKTNFRDIINGKESGCVFLLAGEPGTGKTITAEAVAEILHRPLYKFSISGIDDDTYYFDNELKRIFNIAYKHNAILLIDEADIYLKKRDNDNVLRNVMVSTFLRHLEYHNGIIFLTTNRADDIDQAFDSRIIQTFHFDLLTIEEKKKIWRNMLVNFNVELNNNDADKLAELSNNGRHIKNIIKAASSLAVGNNKELTPDILISVAEFMTNKTNTFEVAN